MRSAHQRRDHRGIQALEEVPARQLNGRTGVVTGVSDDREIPTTSHAVSKPKRSLGNLRVPQAPSSLRFSCFSDWEQSQGQPLLRFSAGATENKNKQAILNPPKTFRLFSYIMVTFQMPSRYLSHGESKDIQESICICSDYLHGHLGAITRHASSRTTDD